MYRGPFRASLALLQLVFLLGIQVAEGLGVHRCPDHDAGVGILASHAQMPGMAGHAEHQSTAPQHAHACHCVGACSAPTPIALSTGLPRIQLAVERYNEPALPGVVAERDSPRLLPFAIGPPHRA